MKLLVFSLAFCLWLLTYAQPNSSLTAEQTKVMLEIEFSKVDKTKLSALVPFKKNGKWGFIYADTRKVAVKPCFTFINLFNPDFIGFCNEWEVEITAKPFSIDVHEQRVFCNDNCTNTFERVFVISSKTNFKGFTVDMQGNLESYADIYYIDENRRDISSPFEYNYEFYAIASRNDSVGIIDVFGEPLQGFDFNYKRIILNHYALDKSQKWFYVEDFSGNCFFISTSGAKKFENKNLKIPLFTNISFGLSVVNTETVSGVFDLSKMDWMIQPQLKNRIEVLYYSSTKEVDYLDPKNRDKVTIYFLAHTPKKEFFVDEKLMPFLPK